MNTRPEIRKDAAGPNPQTKAAATVQSQDPQTDASPKSAVDGKATPMANRFAAFRKEIPEMLLSYEPQPVSAYCNNPVLDERGAAAFLGLSQDLLKKWRQRSYGPNYIQYGKNGPVRYEFNELTEFRAFHRVQLRSTQ
jgi:hypothetical protein